MQKFHKVCDSGIARAFSGGQLALAPGGPKWGQKWGNFVEKSKKIIKILGKMRKVELLPTQDYKDGYTPGVWVLTFLHPAGSP